MGSPVLDQACVAGQMVGDLIPASGGSPSSVGQFKVGYSGESIVFTPQDAQGQPLPVTAVQNSDDVQTILIQAPSTSSSFTLQLSNQTTAPIALAVTPPLVSFVWKATLPQAGTIDISMSYGFYGPPPNGTACSAALLEVYDGGSLVGSVSFDQTQYPDPSTDLAVSGVGIFKALGTFTFATTTLEIRLSGPASSSSLLAGTIRTAPHGSTDPAAAGYIDPSPNREHGSDGVLEGTASIATYGGWNVSYFYTVIGSWHGIFYATPLGTQTTRFPRPNDVQAALQALPNVPPGSVQVSAVSNQGLTVHFTGALGGQTVPTMVSSEPGLAVIHDNTVFSSVGGLYPSVAVNGVTQTLQAVSYASGSPSVVYHLIQDAPDVQYLRFGEGLFQSGYYFVAYNSGFGGQVGMPTGAGPKGLWRFQGLPGKTQYQVAITWTGGDTNADLMDCIIQDGAGNTLATIAGIDQSQTPHDFQDSGVGWMILANLTLPNAVNSLSVSAVSHGTGDKHLLLDTVQIRRVSPRQAIKILPGDQILFSAPAGFLTTTNGPLPAQSNVIVAPAGASRLPALPTGQKSMKLGYNIDPPGYFGIDSYYANIAVQAQCPVGLAQSSQGNPTRLPFDNRYGYGAFITPLSQAPSDTGGSGRGVPSYANGVWVVEWQGSTFNDCRLVVNATSTGIVEDTSRRVEGTVNRRFYQVHDSFVNSPGVALGFFSTLKNPDSTYKCDISNVAVYPPDIDPTQPTKWRPSFLAKLKGLQCIRFMDLFGTNNLNLSSFAHFPDPANFPLGFSGRALVAPIASISPPTADLFAENVAGTVVRITTKVPHGLATGFNIRIRNGDGTSLGQVLGNVIDPNTRQTTSTARDPIDPTDGYNGQARGGLCHVIDATTIQLGINVGSGPLARMTNTLTPSNGYIYADIAPGAMMPPADAADLCVQVGVEPWVNVPWLADDDCVTQMAQAFASRIPRGTRIHVEYGNEAWNYAFSAFFYCADKNLLDGGSGVNYIPPYASRMAQVHQIFRNVWQAAGRDVTEVRRVCGAQYDGAGQTTQLLVNYALANGITFDEIAPASYYSNGPASGANDDLLTVDQLLDLFAVNLQQSAIPQTLAGHLRIFAAALAQNPSQTWLKNVVLVNYEGGPDTMITGAMTANLASRSHAIHRHPGFVELQMYYLQMLESASVQLFNIFTLYGTRDISQWGVYEGLQMQPGTGDPTIDLANLNDFENLPLVKSETAGALLRWASLLPAPISPAATIKSRNGTATTYGRPAYSS